MKISIRCLVTYMLIASYAIQSNETTPPLIEAKPGQKVLLSFADNPENFDIHENNKMRYAQLTCKGTTHTCTLKVKKRIAQSNEPVTFAIFDKEIDEEVPKVKAYVKIVSNENESIKKGGSDEKEWS